MVQHVCHNSRAGLLSILLIGGASLVAGCPGDRAMFFNVTMQVLDAGGRPRVGEKAFIIPSAQYRWPRPEKRQGDNTAINPAEYGEAHQTDPNGLITFTITNTEPVQVPTCIITDMFFPAVVKFLMMLPERVPAAYAVTFRPGCDYAEDKVTYRHFDLKTCRLLSGTYSDDSGGLDIVVHKPPRDPNNRWASPRPSLHIKVLTQIETPG